MSSARSRPEENGVEDPVWSLAARVMRRQPGSRRRTLIAVLLVAAVAAFVYGFLSIGRFLAHQDPLEPADAIFVFAGTRVERPLEAADLYKAHYAPTVVLTVALSESAAVEEAGRRGITVTSDIDEIRTLLVRLGVPAEVILIPERIHDNTAAEANTLRALAVSHGWQRVIVVSSMYHLRRVSLATRRALRGTGVRVIARGSRYDPSTPDRWWQRRADVRWLFSEVPKLAAYAAGVGE
jgi:uncharacterized SAM-binding protein YcdF (DUF218 family)